MGETQPQDPSGAGALSPLEASLERRKPGIIGSFHAAQEASRADYEAVADGTASFVPIGMGLHTIKRDALMGTTTVSADHTQE